MQLRRGLTWFGALALLLVVPPVASSVVDDLGTASVKSERKQNARLDHQSHRLSGLGKQLRRLQVADYGLARAYMITDADRMEAIRGATLVTSPIPQNGVTPAMATLTFPVVRGESDQGVTVRGAIAGALVGGKKGAAIGAGGAGLYAVCAPLGGDTCAGGTVSAGETVCEISPGYDSSTGVLTLVDIPQRSALDDDSAPKATDPDIGGGTCDLPPGDGRYDFFLSIEFQGAG
jgi:hypothetical protein